MQPKGRFNHIPRYHCDYDRDDQDHQYDTYTKT